MSFLSRNRGEGDQEWVADGLAEVAGGLLDIAFDEWGFFLLIIAGVVLVVFVAVSLFGALLSGEGFNGLR